MRQSGGLQFWDLRFMQTRIAYEIGLQEAASNYAGYAPMNTMTNYQDTNWGNGQAAFELVPGYDCPENAVFRDLNIFKDGTAITHRNALCIFELNEGVPLTRHFDTDHHGSFYFYGASPSTALVVRAINAVYNYDYVNGTQRCTASAAQTKRYRSLFAVVVRMLATAVSIARLISCILQTNVH